MSSSSSSFPYRLSRMKKLQICLVVAAFVVLIFMEQEILSTKQSDQKERDGIIQIKNVTTTHHTNVVPSQIAPTINQPGEAASSSPDIPVQPQSSPTSSLTSPPPTPLLPPTTPSESSGSKPANPSSHSPSTPTGTQSTSSTPKPTTKPIVPSLSTPSTVASAAPQPTSTTSDNTPKSEPVNPSPDEDDDEDSKPIIPPQPPVPTPTSPSSNNNIPANKTGPVVPISETSQRFVDQYCDLAPLKSWFPSEGTKDIWQIRAPYVILAGVWNSGIQDVQNQLMKNYQTSLQLPTKKESGFFLPKNIYKFQIRHRTKVFSARQKMFAQLYNTKVLKDQETTTSNQYYKKYYYMDVSPGYLFYPQTIYPILCTVPWSKFLIVLRNPIDRLYKQYVYSVNHFQLKLSLEDWIAREMKVMQSVGLLVQIPGSDEEREAFRSYQSGTKATISGAIGRSMYVLQLQEWFHVINQAGIDPHQVVYVVPSEKLFVETSKEGDSSNNTIQASDDEFRKILEFLNLPSHTTTKDISTKLTTTTTMITDEDSSSTIPKMKEETYQLLQEFFAPYNERLYELLGQHYGNYDWQNVWK